MLSSGMVSVGDPVLASDVEGCLVVVSKKFLLSCPYCPLAIPRFSNYPSTIGSKRY